MSLAADQETMPLILGIDIGGTKTHLRAEGRGIRQDRILSTAVWRERDWDADASRLLAMASELVQGAEIDAIGIGAHGCDDASECDAFQAAFAARSPVRTAVVNDAELMPLAMGLHGQIGLVAGTGSIAVCRTASGGMLVAGGWGWIIGDEGSAASIVREAARAVALYMDTGGSKDEPLAALLFEALEIPRPARIGSAISCLGSATAVGGYAHLVFEAATLGSHVAQGVIRDGGQALAALVQRLDARGAGASEVVAGGGVIVAQPLLWHAFVEALADDARHISPHLFGGNPVEGACRLAATLAASSDRSRNEASATRI
ncbi:N-acetylglucosamine kinase [Nitratireductor thuwali]|uniref:ATPase BadF/BadG/BcrA/BcrD type domain-containing protein n=1 Tax=Nitratireductor thuwali TaxID=2267699 RepID=A0ABY5MPD4_9HYPH|nr:hypothetical protein NTH_03141 [Nitratireductor thuwali]